jgi:hypothetical protein
MKKPKADAKAKADNEKPTEKVKLTLGSLKPVSMDQLADISAGF